MQGTGRRGAPSLFVTLPRTGLCAEPCSGLCARLCSGLCAEPGSGLRARLCSGLCARLCSGLCAEPGSGLRARLCSGLCARLCSGPRARLCSGPHGSHLLPHTVIAAPPLAPLPCRPHHCCSLRAVRIFVRRPSPACHIPDHAVPRACRSPAAFLRPSGVRFAHVTQQMYAHLLNTLKINMLQSRRKKTIS